jgi:hypothetical protein
MTWVVVVWLAASGQFIVHNYPTKDECLRDREFIVQPVTECVMLDRKQNSDD